LAPAPRWGGISFVPAEACAPSRPRHFVLREDRFGRIFPDLPPFFTSVTDELKAAMVEIGKPGATPGRWEGPEVPAPQKSSHLSAPRLVAPLRAWASPTGHRRKTS
jgi:hypothetical protein